MSCTLRTDRFTVMSNSAPFCSYLWRGSHGKNMTNLLLILAINHWNSWVERRRESGRATYGARNGSAIDRRSDAEVLEATVASHATTESAVRPRKSQPNGGRR